MSERAADTGTTVAVTVHLRRQLRGLEKWDPDGADRCCTEDSRRWRRIVRELLDQGHSTRPDNT
ncbi:hypothetical protein GCM10009837_42880 [Streptomyces durmitorensis]|uniref:Transposase n=1 Tax=Streptomyces durmitorensis TaxID=319947 RepID=A0ABY4Q4Q7_9ACTN|nr:hypothetical protein [Streptomyces durmitorensis]UQT60697.1 hypothetical protein M4V62_39615 [Streptomyces durmitorensis]